MITHADWQRKIGNRMLDMELSAKSNRWSLERRLMDVVEVAIQAVKE